MPEPDLSAVRTAEKPRILVFFDFACQFCYLDWPRFKRLRDEHDVEMLLVPFELRPEMPADGLPIADVGGGHSPRIEEYMRRMADEATLELAFPHFVPNTHRALSLGEYARDLGSQTHEAVHEAIFSAYGGRGEDIGRFEVLLGIAQEHGLDTDDVRQALAEGRFDARIHQFYHLALSIGVSATPAALICNELLIGSRPLAVLQQSLDRCLVTAEKVESGAASEPNSLGEADDGEVDSDEGEPPTLDR